jgi:hypothetical protein
MKQAGKWMITFAIISVFLVLMVGSGESEDTSSTEDTAAPKTAYKVGDEVPVGNFIYRLDSAAEQNVISSGNEFLDDLTTTGKFVIVQVTVLNNDKESRMVDGSMFKLVGSDGTEFSAYSEADMYINSDLGFFLEQVNPKMTRTGKIAFEVPADASGLQLEVSSGLGWSGGEYEVINLP